MGIYYKPKSEKHYKTIPIHDPYVSRAHLKRMIVEKLYSKSRNRHSKVQVNEKGQCVGCDFDISLVNAQTGEVYVGDSTLIPNYTSVLVCRLPGDRRRLRVDAKPIVVIAKSNNAVDSDVVVGSENCVASCSGGGSVRVLDDDDFGGDVYARPGAKESVLDAGTGLIGKAEDAVSDMGGEEDDIRVAQGNVPPFGYVCHRCKIRGHFIKDCPRKEDPEYNQKRVRKPKGIPKSMLQVNRDGSYMLEDGKCATLKVNEEAFDRLMEGWSSSTLKYAWTNMPPELNCPLCNKPMSFAMMTSNCCLHTFCDPCIRDYLISNQKCVCGNTKVLNDHLIPNITVRDAISRLLCGDSSSSGS